jgi:two-component system nitrate/nitrite response regulator NarL
MTPENPGTSATLDAAAVVRVLIADDHPVYRAGVAAFIERRADMELVCQVGNGEQALAEISRTSPDVALIDLRLPGIDGIEVIDILGRELAPTKGIIVSAYQDGATVYRAIAAGARAYLPKIASGDVLCSTIRAVADGRTVIPTDLQTGFAEVLRSRRNVQGDPVLTRRELEILQLTSEGGSIKDIASELFVGVTTVKTHLQHIYEKLGVTDRAAAVAKALRTGLLE